MSSASFSFNATTSVRPPAVAGLFYPDDTDELTEDVDDMLAAAEEASPPSGRPKAIVVPHAGYVYSGPVAASAYAAIKRATPPYERAVILGPAHRVAIRGLALPGASAFATPLGDVAVDPEAVALLSDLPVSRSAHAEEHSLEVQLPFLVRALGRVKIVPLAVGGATVREVAAVLDRLWGGPETLIVISTDLSHFLAYDEAKRIDGATAERVLAMQHDIDHEEACGATPLNGLLAVAKRRGLTPRLLDIRSSGDTRGPRNQVVGYASFAFYEPD